MEKTPLFLTILSISLLLTLSACAANGSGVAGTSWKLTSYGPASAPIPAVPGVETDLTFGANGQLSGRLGCNSMGGDYSVSGQKITFGSVFATQMACDEARMAQEDAAFQVLNNTVSFTVSGNTLTITSADGKSILVFTQQ